MTPGAFVQAVERAANPGSGPATYYGIERRTIWTGRGSLGNPEPQPMVADRAGLLAGQGRGSLSTPVAQVILNGCGDTVMAVTMEPKTELRLGLPVLTVAAAHEIEVRS